MKALIIAAFALFIIAGFKNLGARINRNTDELKRKWEQDDEQNRKRDERGNKILDIAQKASQGRRKLVDRESKGDEIL